MPETAPLTLERIKEMFDALTPSPQYTAVAMSAATKESVKRYIETFYMTHPVLDVVYIECFRIWIDNSLPFGDYKLGNIIKGKFKDGTRNPHV
jgi:hypothetical protein